jgi:two-component system, OmpR family, sensor histidine kinase KdpD
MSELGRADPDELLKRVPNEGRKRARFKIFFGMSAGVGKTYAMLREARLLIERGEDVVVGWVEPHGRAETETLADGMERIPPRLVDYRGTVLREFDAEAAIARRPSILIVDELAHSNAPGMTHPKRYQDILDVLESGISVYTTMNIQHLESLADSVELVTLVPVRERVPDEVFDRADEIQMVDIPPEELIKRLSEGKVYSGATSKEAMTHFFTRENLSVLREIALREAAQLASHQTLDIMRGDSPPRNSGAQRILVAVSRSPNSEHLIRWTRKLAYALKEEWDCITVDSGDPLTEEEKTRLANNLGFAKSLGAKVSNIPADDVARAVLDHARRSGASIIVVGKSGSPSPRHPFARRSITDRIMAESGNIAVLAVQEKPLHDPRKRRTVAGLLSSPPRQYATAVAVVALTTVLNSLITPFVGYWGAAVPYLATISIIALFIGRGPLFVSALLSALLWDYLFIPPYHTFYISKLEDALMLVLYILLAVTSGWMTGKLKANERLLSVRERRLELLNTLATELAGTPGLGETARKSVAFLEDAFDARVFLLMRDKAGDLEPVPPGPLPAELGERELTAARHCLQTGRRSGRGTDAMGSSTCYFAPLGNPPETVGVVGLSLAPGKAWTGDTERFLSIVLHTVSLAMERELLTASARESELVEESERLGKLLLDSVSHELKTPLTIIQGSASALSDEDIAKHPLARRELVGEMMAGAERLTGIVDNLLSMNRLESGKINLRLSETDPADLVSVALKTLEKGRGSREVELAAEGLEATLYCDQGLITQVLTNLVQNAYRYSGEASRICIRVSQTADRTGFEVSDDGPGVPSEDLAHLFEKFYRGRGAKPGGTGLGLSICRGIVEAHGGEIRAWNGAPPVRGGGGQEPQTKAGDGRRGFTIAFSLPNDPRPKEGAR